MRTIEERIIDTVDFDLTTGCWNWAGTVTEKGYPWLMIKKQGKRGNRVSYAAFIGPILPGNEIDHVCFNRKCVNPQHLDSLTREQHIEANRDRLSYGGRLGGRVKKRSDLPYGLSYCHKKYIVARIRDPLTKKRINLGCRTINEKNSKESIIAELSELVKAKCAEINLPYTLS